MGYQAIVTKYYGATNNRGARIKATAAAGSVWSDYDHGLSADDNHAQAARLLARKFGWTGKYIGGGMPDGTGNVYVCEQNHDSFVVG